MKHTRRFALLLLALSPILAAGCQAMAWPFLMWGKEPTKTIAAEYPHLAGKKVCILVWADSDTLFQYQFVRLEVAEFIAAALKTGVKGVSVVPPRSVSEYQRTDPDWDRKSPGKIGSKFSADRVLMVELTQYTTREPENPHLYRAHIAANIKVYDAAQGDAGPTFRTTAEMIYPPGAAAEWGSSDDSVRKAGMESFGAEVAGKFYDRQVKVK